ARSRISSLRCAHVCVPIVLARVGLHRALSVDVANCVAADRLDSGSAPPARRRRSCGSAALQGRIRRRHCRPREGVSGGPRTGATRRQGEACKGRSSSRSPPQGGGRETQCPYRRSGEDHCRDAIGGDAERAQHRRRGCRRDCRTADWHRAGGRRGRRSHQQSAQALRKPMFEAEFWVAVAFVIFVGLLGYFRAHKLLLNSIDDRRGHSQAEVAEAGRVQAEAEALLATYRRKQQEAEHEAQAIVAGAKAEAERLAAEAETKIEEFVVRRTKMAESKIAQAEAQALADVRSAAAEVAVAAAKTILTRTVKDKVANDLLAKGIADFKGKLN